MNCDAQLLPAVVYRDPEQYAAFTSQFLAGFMPLLQPNDISSLCQAMIAVQAARVQSVAHNMVQRGTVLQAATED